jgi:hypothetical protein
MLITRRLSILNVHSKPILIPLLYDTRVGTIKMHSKQDLSNFARTGQRDVIAYNYDVLYTNE